MRMVDSDTGKNIAFTDTVDERRLGGTESEPRSCRPDISGRGNALGNDASVRTTAGIIISLMWVRLPSSSGMDWIVGSGGTGGIASVGLLSVMIDSVS